MTPMLGNLAALLIFTLGFAILFAFEKFLDRRNRTRYLPKPSHRGATRRVITARKCP